MRATYRSTPGNSAYQTGHVRKRGAAGIFGGAAERFSMRSNWLYFATAIGTAQRPGFDLRCGRRDGNIGDGRVFGFAPERCETTAA